MVRVGGCVGAWLAGLGGPGAMGITVFAAGAALSVCPPEELLGVLAAVPGLLDFEEGPGGESTSAADEPLPDVGVVAAVPA